jgi:hypothetical protein
LSLKQKKGVRRTKEKRSRSSGKIIIKKAKIELIDFENISF